MRTFRIVITVDYRLLRAVMTRPEYNKGRQIIHNLALNGESSKEWIAKGIVENYLVFLDMVR